MPFRFSLLDAAPVRSMFVFVLQRRLWLCIFRIVVVGAAGLCSVDPKRVYRLNQAARFAGIAADIIVTTNSTRLTATTSTTGSFRLPIDRRATTAC